MHVCPSICRAPYLRNHTSCDHSFWYTYVEWWFLQGRFFSFFFFLILIFWPKMKNKNYISHVVSQEKCSILSWFLMHLCKMISPVSFPFFSKFCFFLSCLAGWKFKKWSKMTKNYACQAPYLRNHTSYVCHIWYTFVKW